MGLCDSRQLGETLGVTGVDPFPGTVRESRLSYKMSEPRVGGGMKIKRTPGGRG